MQIHRTATNAGRGGVPALLALGAVLLALWGCGPPAADWSIDVGPDPTLSVPVGGAVDFRLVAAGDPPAPVTWSEPSVDWLRAEVSPDRTEVRVRGRAPIGASADSPYDVALAATAADGSIARSAPVRVDVRPLEIELREHDTGANGTTGSQSFTLDLGYTNLRYLPDASSEIEVFVNTANLHFDEHKCNRRIHEYCQDRLRITDGPNDLSIEQRIRAQVTRNSDRPDLGELIRSSDPAIKQAFADGTVDLTVATQDEEQWFLYGIWVTIE